MADDARVTHQDVEVILTPDNQAVRSTHESVEVVVALDPSLIYLRSSEMFVEVFVQQPYYVAPTPITRSTSLNLAG